MMITPDTIVKASAGQVSTEVMGSAAILHVKKGTYFGLDGVGATIWKLIQEPRPVAGIRDALLDKYDVDAATCQQDLLELLEELVAEGLVETIHGAQ